MARGADAAASREERLAELHERLREQVDALVSGEDWKAALRFAARLHRYSFSNTLLIWGQHAERFEQGSVTAPEPTHVAGFRAWKALGRAVDKGQRGYLIQAPRRRTLRFAVDEAGETRPLPAGEEPGSGERLTKRTTVAGFTPAYVWDVSQTSGEPIPTRPAPVVPAGHAPAGLWDGLARQVTARGFALHDAPNRAAMNGAWGRTDYETRTVSVAAGESPAMRVLTLAHELAHVLLHDPQAPGNDGVDVADIRRGVREVEAESTTFLVAEAHGMDTGGFTYPYVAEWASSGSSDPAAVVQATGTRALTAAGQIMAGLDTDHTLGGTPPGLDHAVARGHTMSAPQRQQQAPAPLATTRPGV